MRGWRKLNQNGEPIEIPRTPIVGSNDKILALGSCFAHEVRDYLKRRGYDVLNHETDPEPQLIWYNTFSILYEFQRLTREFHQGQDDFWSTGRGWQDPYRRFVFGSTIESVRARTSQIDSQMSAWIQTADVVIVTLGLTEVWFQPNGKAICAFPGYGGGGGDNCIFSQTDYGENLHNMLRICEIINMFNRNAKVIVTVSPVPLGSTFTTQDSLVANCDSKSILRAVAGHLARRGNAYYFPSYELVLQMGRDNAFQQDGRHVRSDAVARVMQTFEAAFVH